MAARLPELSPPPGGYPEPDIPYSDGIWLSHREKIVSIARGWIGTPYHHQASLKYVGCDCFGLVRGVWRELYDDNDPETPPPYSWDWAEAKDEETMLEAARRHMLEVSLRDAGAGDVMLFRYKEGFNAKHSVVLSGGGRMIHAIQGAPVCEVHMGDWWFRRAAGAFRFPLELR